MWAETEIDERRAVDVINADVVAGFLVDEFTLQWFLPFTENPQGFGLRNLLATITEVLTRDLLHPFFDDRQIGFGYRARRDHVVEKAVTRIVEQCWSNAEFRAGKKIEDRSGEQVRG